MNKLKSQRLCTILIPTYNRPNSLRQLLRYYNHLSVKFKIIVADSSEKNNIVKNRQVISELENLDIEHLDKFTPELPLFNKISKALNNCKTDYTLICADDDFVLPNAIEYALTFLEKNKDYSAVQGRFLTYHITKNDGEIDIKIGQTYSLTSVEDNNPLKRLNQHLSQYGIPTFYALHRTNIMQNIFQIATNQTSDLRFGELLLSILTVIDGKYSTFNLLYGIREINLTSDSQIIDGFDSFIRKNIFTPKYEKFEDSLVDHLLTISDLDKDFVQRSIRKSFGSYLINFFPTLTYSEISSVLPMKYASFKKSKILKRVFQDDHRIQFIINLFKSSDDGDYTLKNDEQVDFDTIMKFIKQTVND